MSLPTLAAASTPPPCGLATLNGAYLFSASGYTIANGVTQPKAIVEMIHFNGDGSLSVTGGTVSINGVIIQIPPGGTGTFTYGTDCKGTVSFTGGPSFGLYGSGKGKEFLMIQTDPNNIFRGEVRKVGP
jgi:hypothetical protein